MHFMAMFASDIMRRERGNNKQDTQPILFSESLNARETKPAFSRLLRVQVKSSGSAHSGTEPVYHGWG